MEDEHKSELTDEQKIKQVRNLRMKEWRTLNRDKYNTQSRERYKVKSNDAEKGDEFRRKRYESCKKSALNSYNKLMKVDDAPKDM